MPKHARASRTRPSPPVTSLRGLRGYTYSLDLEGGVDLVLAVQLRQQRPIAGRCLFDGRPNAARPASGDAAGGGGVALAATAGPDGAADRRAGLARLLRLLFDGGIRLHDGEAIVERQLCGAVHVDLVDRLHDDDVAVAPLRLAGLEGDLSVRVCRLAKVHVFAVEVLAFKVRNRWRIGCLDRRRNCGDAATKYQQ